MKLKTKASLQVWIEKNVKIIVLLFRDKKWRWRGEVIGADDIAKQLLDLIPEAERLEQESSWISRGRLGIRKDEDGYEVLINGMPAQEILFEFLHNSKTIVITERHRKLADEIIKRDGLKPKQSRR